MRKTRDRSSRPVAGSAWAACFVLIWLSAPVGLVAQGNAVLYGGLIQTKGYVVGAPLAEAGFHRFDGDTVWTHMASKNPRVNGIAFHPTDPDIIYLAAGNGAMRTLDGGRNWRIATDWNVTESQDIELDQRAPDHVYVATAYGVWRTEDSGDTWMESNNGISKKYCQTIEIDRTRAHRLLAGTEGGVFLSTDGAKSWKRVSPMEIEVNDIEQSRAEPNLWMAGAQKGGVLLSSDNGQTWTAVGGATAGRSVYAVTMHPTNPDIMAATGWDTGVLYSSDRGKTWRQIGNPLPVDDNYDIIFDLNNPSKLIVATVESGIFYTTDTGANWTYMGMYGTLVFDLTFREPLR